MALRYTKRPLLARILLLTAFGVAFGHIEAVVVVYIRRVLGWVPLPTDIGPEMMARVPGWLIHTEQTREAATIILLLAVACLAGRIFTARLAVFLFSFGAWDITYYVSLRVMLGWPETFRTPDCLFLIPKPWLGPVWLPISIAACMIALAVGILFAIEKASVEPVVRVEAPARKKRAAP